jgi:hypothetical protein
MLSFVSSLEWVICFNSYKLNFLYKPTIKHDKLQSEINPLETECVCFI